jgi:hypothetical protein
MNSMRESSRKKKGYFAKSFSKLYLLTTTYRQSLCQHCFHAINKIMLIVGKG